MNIRLLLTVFAYLFFCFVSSDRALVAGAKAAGGDAAHLRHRRPPGLQRRYHGSEGGAESQGALRLRGGGGQRAHVQGWRSRAGFGRQVKWRNELHGDKGMSKKLSSFVDGSNLLNLV